MSVKIESEKFIDIKNITAILNKNVKLVSYKYIDGMLKGTIEVVLDYLSNITEDAFNYEKEFEFEIVCSSVGSVELTNYEISLIEGIGIELAYNLEFEEERDAEINIIKESLDIKLDDALKEIDDSFLDDRKCMDLKEEINENIKEQISDSIEEIKEGKNEEIIEEQINELKEEIMDDKQELFESKIPNFNDSYSKIKILFIENTSLNEVALKYNLDVKKIYEDNNYEIGNRIIIKDE